MRSGRPRPQLKDWRRVATRYEKLARNFCIGRGTRRGCHVVDQLNPVPGTLLEKRVPIQRAPISCVGDDLLSVLAKVHRRAVAPRTVRLSEVGGRLALVPFRAISMSWRCLRVATSASASMAR